jgi:phenylalanyl-tRNA synthetase beta chain
MLVIADENKPVAVAGVMGGEYSGIMDDTTAVVFESACFDGASVRTTAKKLGMRTDASARFEKGLDPETTYPALMRAFELVEMLGCGEVVKTYIDCDKSNKERKGVEYNPAWINAFLGTQIPEAEMTEYLTRLNFEIKDGKAYAPYYRIDIECNSDLAEEVARLYGYSKIPDTIIGGVAEAKLTRKQKFERNVTSAMLGMGVNEITTFSFISPKYFDKIRLPEDSALRNTVKIMNPLGEDTSVMRTTILPSVCEVLARNYSFRNPECYAFELGSEYIPVDGEVLPNEPERLGIGIYDTTEEIDFYTIKGIIEELLDKCGAPEYDVARADENTSFGEAAAFHPGRCAVISVDGKELAIFGELHPETLENYGIGCRAYAAKVNIPELMEVCTEQKTYKPLPKFPATTRDLSLLCDDELPAAAIEKTIRKAAGAVLEKVTLFDIYKGKQIADGKKSVSYSLTLRSHDATLTDEQADKVTEKVLRALSEIGAELRRN